jgi:prepilin-type N-terminal cleavage/methylation domain-containing protein
MTRAFTLIEMMAVAAVAAAVSAVAIGLTVKTSDDLNNVQVKMAVLDFIQRERNSHVNRAVEEEAVIFCAAAGAGVCAANGDTLVAYRVLLPVTLPPPPAAELDRVSFPGSTFTFAPAQVLVVDALARSTDAIGAPTTTILSLALRGGITEDIVFRADGVAIPSFDAPSAIVVAPHVADLGSRTTPNPTPQSRPNTTFRARRVFLE